MNEHNRSSVGLLLSQGVCIHVGWGLRHRMAPNMPLVCEGQCRFCKLAWVISFHCTTLESTADLRSAIYSCTFLTIKTHTVHVQLSVVPENRSALGKG